MIYVYIGAGLLVFTWGLSVLATVNAARAARVARDNKKAAAEAKKTADEALEKSEAALAAAKAALETAEAAAASG